MKNGNQVRMNREDYEKCSKIANELKEKRFKITKEGVIAAGTIVLGCATSYIIGYKVGAYLGDLQTGQFIVDSCMKSENFKKGFAEVMVHRPKAIEIVNDCIEKLKN